MLINLHLTMQRLRASQSAERNSIQKESFSDVQGKSGEKQLLMMHEPENERKADYSRGICICSWQPCQFSRMWAEEVFYKWRKWKCV